MEQKPGFTTSEFWVALATGLGSVLGSDFLSASDRLAVIGLAGLYLVCRTVIKIMGKE